MKKKDLHLKNKTIKDRIKQLEESLSSNMEEIEKNKSLFEENKALRKKQDSIMTEISVLSEQNEVYKGKLLQLEKKISELSKNNLEIMLEKDELTKLLNAKVEELNDFQESQIQKKVETSVQTQPVQSHTNDTLNIDLQKIRKLEIEKEDFIEKNSKIRVSKSNSLRSKSKLSRKDRYTSRFIC